MYAIPAANLSLCNVHQRRKDTGQEFSDLSNFQNTSVEKVYVVCLRDGMDIGHDSTGEGVIRKIVPPC